MDVSCGAYECRIKCAGRQKRLKSSDAKSKETSGDTLKVSIMKSFLFLMFFFF